MIVDRELEIRNFKPEPFYTIDAMFSKDGGDPFKASHATKQFKDRKAAEEILDKITGKQGKVMSVEKKSVETKPPLLYSLSALQMAANSKYGYTLADTLTIAQSLYEAGYTTYPRTDSQYLTDDMKPVVNKTLDQIAAIPQYGDLINGRPRDFDRKRYFNSAKVTSHFAIIPTGSVPKGLDEKGSNIYDLIARSLIMMLYPPSKGEKTSIVIDVDGERFNAAGSVIKEKGWMEVDGTSSKDAVMPPLSEGDLLDGEYSISDKMTKPPKRYTDKTLMQAMISAGSKIDDDDLRKLLTGKHGIGTEATRAAILFAIFPGLG